MRSKQLLTLAVLLVVLVVAVMLFKRQPTSTKLADEVGFERILPALLTADAIQGIDLYQGDNKDKTVQLRREGDTWVAASYHNAPVQADKVTSLLDSVSGLEGDIRAEKAEVLDVFKLQDAEALHLLLYTDKLDEPQVHLLAGKSSGRTGFVRRADQHRVYSVNLNLRTEAGLYGDETDTVPEAKPWLNLQLQDIAKDHVTGVELQMPERRLQLALKKPESVKPSEDGKPKDGEATSEDKPEAAAATPEAKPEWELVEPQVSYPLKQGVVEGLVSTLRTLRGDDVVAPDKAAEYGLDSPSYRAVLTVEEKGKDARQVAVAVGKTVSEEDEKHYVRLEQNNSPVYLLPKWSFNQVFPTLGAILTLDVLSLKSDDIVRVSWQHEGQSLTLERQSVADASSAVSEEKPSTEPEANKAVSDEEPSTEPEANKAVSDEEPSTEPEVKKDVWRWVQASDVEVDADKLTALLDTVEHLTADDWFADAPAEAGLDQPVLSLSITLRNGTTHNVTFGQTRGKDEDRYVGLQSKAGTFVVAKTSYTSITDALKSLRPKSAAAAPDYEPKPAIAAPKLEMPNTESAVKPISEGATVTRPKQGMAPEASTMMKMPIEARPTPLSVPNPTAGANPDASSTGEVSAAPATGTEPITPAKIEGKQ